jgi:hypothetical protein
LSPFLFNFYYNQFIEECINANKGCKLDQVNLSAIAYCDDLALLGPSVSGMCHLINICMDLGEKWKIKFNPKKSTCMTFRSQDDKSRILPVFVMNGTRLTNVSQIDYLGFRHGLSKESIGEHWESKMDKVERAMFSLNSIGCHSNGIGPLKAATLYRIYCQPIFSYGLETSYLSSSSLSKFDTRQATLIKKILGVSKYTRTKALMCALRISSLSELYCRAKLSFWAQLHRVDSTKQIYSFLKEFYKGKKQCSKKSFIKQMDNIEKKINIELSANNYNNAMKKLKDSYVHENNELVCKIQNICKMIEEDFSNRSFYQSILKEIISVRIDET